MTDPYLHEDDLVTQALRLNWDHARHVEIQRLQLTAVYVAMAFGLGLAALHPGDPVIRIGAAVLGSCVTLICWGMTHKLNRAFVNLIEHADRCARRLGIREWDERSEHEEFVALHAFLGFPRMARERVSIVRRSNVRVMFHLLYGGFALTWLILLAYLIFRIFAPERPL